MADASRELLETQYLSLRAHYVAASKRLAAAMVGSDAVCKTLQSLIDRRAAALACRRVRLAVAREIHQVLMYRAEELEKLSSGSKSKRDKDAGGNSSDNTNGKGNSIDGFEDEEGLCKAWDRIENTLIAAEAACADESLEPVVNQIANGKHKNLKDEVERTSKRTGKSLRQAVAQSGRAPLAWENSPLPSTPHGIPLLISVLSSAPDKIAAVSYGGIFGSSENELTWLEGGMPASMAVREKEQDSLALAQSQCSRMVQKVVTLRKSCTDLQSLANNVRKQCDKVNSNITMLRTETEAVLNRHHIVLETPEAKKASATLRAQEEREEKEKQEAEEARKVSQGRGRGFR